MKGQDILLLLKLVALRKRDQTAGNAPDVLARYSVRGLAGATGISKSEVGLALQRCFAAGLAARDPRTDIALPVLPAVREFLAHGLMYVFPVQPGAQTWGIATGWSAPGLGLGLAASSARSPVVWPDPAGQVRGAAVAPLFRSVAAASALDAHLYAMLALADALRLARPDEQAPARQALLHQLGS